MQKTKTPLLSGQDVNPVNKNNGAKKRPELLRQVKIQYILVLVTFILLIGLGGFYLNTINQVATETAISSYQQTELEIVREAARGAEEYVYTQTVVLGRTDIPTIEQEVYTKFIDPIHLLKNGDAWIYAPDHIVFDQSADMPPEYWGKSMAEIFAIQQQNGASHYEEMTSDVSNAREGTGYYVWLPEKGPEIAAWTPVRVGNNTWTIGLSTPLPEILEASGAASQITMATAVILFSILFALILLCLWVYSDSKRRRAYEELHETEERFRMLLQNANDGIFVYEISAEGPGKILIVNDQMCRWSGYTTDELTHMTVRDIDVPEQFEKIPGIIKRLMEDGYAIFETDLLTKDRKRIPVEVSARLFYLQGRQTFLSTVRDITERKKTEEQLKKYNEELRESEDRFRLLFQNASDGIVVHEISAKGAGKFLNVNDQACQLYGYTKDEMTHMHVSDIEDPEQAKRVPEIVGKLMKDGHAVFETNALTKDGNRVPVEVSASTFEFMGKHTVLSIVRDITERKAAEKIRHAAETRFRALIQNSSDIICILGPDSRIFYESPSAERILGYPSSSRIGKDPFNYLHPEDFEQVKNYFREVFEKKNSRNPIEYRIRKADGEYLWVGAIGTNLLDVPEVNGIVVTVRPIQQRKEAEQALQENQIELAAAMDIAGLVNWELDVSSGIFTFNDRFYALYETTAEREGGNQMSAETYMQEFVYPEDRPAVLASIQKILATTDPDYTGQIEHRITPRDGSVRTIIARFVPVMGPDGTVIRTHGANQDITDRKLMESEIQSLNTVLEQRVKERTEALVETNEKLEEENAQRLEAEGKLQKSYDEKVMLLKEVHHRVKNNLQIIASLLNLQSRYIKDEPTLAAIKESQNRVKAMALVHEKLYRSDDISHISLYDYIKFLGTGLFQFYDAKGRGIQFTLEISDVNVDINAAIPLGLIINELISNSLKYAFPDDRTGEVFVSVKKEGHTLTLLFRDNGIGIPADMDWKEAPSLGLRLVTSLVDQLDGTIELDRSAGTAFTMIVKEKEKV